MTVNVSKPAINVREELADLRKPSGVAGEAMLRADTPQEQFNLIGAGRRNLIINGAMQVAQRGTSVTGVVTSTYGACDRWKIMEGSVSVLTLSQDTDAPDGFDNSLKIVPTTADSSVSSSDYSVLNQTIEASSVKGAATGTSSSRPFSLSFWVKSNVTGTYCVELYVTSSTNVSAEYTINQAGVWEYKTVDYPPSQNAFGSNNLSVQFWLLAGSNYSGGSSVKRVWSSGDNTRAAGQVNVLSSTSNYFQITGVQLELGKVATPFDHPRSYGEEMALCQRYYQSVYDSGMSAIAAGRGASGGDAVVVAIPIPVALRASPAVASSGTYYVYDHNSRISSTPNSVTVSNYPTNGTVIALYFAFSGIVCDDDRVNFISSLGATTLTLDAEL